ncbi:unnamed protein product [Prunus armeniaca]|uniref:Uncharacterized protein n=1 Tax=Prunus armeniaca TaxID=36596 RepID=A0A6J5WRR8_PRUAR|nr:unnamed protein product [Prunus armeniaca]CAB4304229.1 unnamed protein product [Prunus armeniaca]
MAAKKWLQLYLFKQAAIPTLHLSLCCIQPIFKGGFYYDLLAKTNESSLRFQSFTKNSAGQVISPSSTGYFIIPSDFFSSGKLNMDLCIWRNGQCPASFQSIGVA